MNQKNLYLYEGPVLQFGKIIKDYWRGGTQAVSENQALAFLSYQIKKKLKLDVKNSKIELNKKYLRLEERMI